MTGAEGVLEIGLKRVNTQVKDVFDGLERQAILLLHLADPYGGIFIGGIGIAPSMEVEASYQIQRLLKSVAGVDFSYPGQHNRSFFTFRDNQETHRYPTSRSGIVVIDKRTGPPNAPTYSTRTVEIRHLWPWERVIAYLSQDTESLKKALNNYLSNT